MRIRFRASDFGLFLKIKLSCKVETGFLCGDDARVIFFFARVVQQLGFWTREVHANVDYYCYPRRRAERTSRGAGIGHSSLRSGSSRGVFFQQSTRAQQESCCFVCDLA